MDLIGELGALGQFFSAEFHDPRSAACGPWQAMSGLVEQPRILDDRVAQVRASLAARDALDEDVVEVRVAASVMHLGMVARLVAPLFALAVLHRRSSPISLAELRWQPVQGSLFPLSLPELAAAEPSAEDSCMDDSCMDDAEPSIAKEIDLAPLVGEGSAVAEFSAACERFDVNGHILRGNVASAFGGAAAALAYSRRDHVPAIRLALSEVLAQPALEDASHLEPGGRLRRHSCCLIYRASPARDGGMCGDCPLPPRSGQRRA